MKIEYPPPYERLVYNYENADSQAINKAIEDFNWEKSFRNADIDGQVRLFNKTVINISKTYNLNKYVTFNGKDLPSLNHHILI